MGWDEGVPALFLPKASMSFLFCFGTRSCYIVLHCPEPAILLLGLPPRLGCMCESLCQLLSRFPLSVCQQTFWRLDKKTMTGLRQDQGAAESSQYSQALHFSLATHAPDHLMSKFSQLQAGSRPLCFAAHDTLSAEERHELVLSQVQQMHRLQGKRLLLALKV